MKRRERERSELRQKILDAAQELFTSEGYEAVSMRSIARKVEYSQSVIYQYFTDKYSLISELCSLNFGKMGLKFAESAAIEDPLARLSEIGKIYLHFAKEYPNHYRMMFMTPHPPIQVEDRGIRKGVPMEDAWAFISNTVREAQEAKLLRDDLGGPEQLAQLFFAAMHGVVSLHIAKSNDPWIQWMEIDEMTQMMVESLLRSFTL